MTDLADLIALLQAAAGPDKKLDVAIHRFINPEHYARFPNSGYLDALRYTAVIDAARSLVPEEWAHRLDFRPWLPPRLQASASVWRREERPTDWQVIGTNEAIALCTAALQARMRAAHG